MSDVTETEQANVRRALRFLRARIGTWKSVAAALNMHWSTIKAVKDGGAVSASVAFRVARLAGVTVDDVITGRYAPVGGLSALRRTDARIVPTMPGKSASAITSQAKPIESSVFSR